MRFQTRGASLKEEEKTLISTTRNSIHPATQPHTATLSLSDFSRSFMGYNQKRSRFTTSLSNCLISSAPQNYPKERPAVSFVQVRFRKGDRRGLQLHPCPCSKPSEVCNWGHVG